MFTRIMIPLDGSPLAESALPIAKTIALATHANVHLVSVPEDELTVSQRIVGYTWIGATQRREHIREERRAYLAELKRQFSADNIETHTKLLDGDVATALIDYANSLEVDLVVMCTHGRTGVMRWALGSIAERVARQLNRPLLLVRERLTVDHILVTLDGSFTAQSILQPATYLRSLFDASMTLLYVRDIHRPPYLAHPETYLEDVVAKWDDEAQAVRFQIRDGVPAETIVDTGVKHSADLICIATHGLHTTRWNHGSVTARVLQQSPLALFIWPSNTAA